MKTRNLGESHKSSLKAAYAKKFARKQMCLQMAHQETVGVAPECHKGSQTKGQDVGEERWAWAQNKDFAIHPSLPAKGCAQEWSSRELQSL